MTKGKVLQERRILARNLPAFACHLVPGNPMTARPESGVGNCHPGLEFDVRALDRHFLPGLVFEFAYGAGARLMDIGPRFAKTTTIRPEAVAAGVFLWAVTGKFGDDPEHEKTAPLLGVDGYMVLRKIMDLERGPVEVLAGVLPRTQAEREQAQDIVERFGVGKTVRADTGLICDCFTGQRAEFLDDKGVIDPDLIAPGELTASLCSPWQWDFADCYCFYWASSKPDIVIERGGGEQVLNFQRDRTAVPHARPARTIEKWTAQDISGPEMITAWTRLPIVISDRENFPSPPLNWPPVKDRLTSLRGIAEELRRLAAIEHAVCIEYLYAKFSINSPRRAPVGLSGEALLRYKSAREVFNIAVDEMRHLRWTNEALWLLNKPPCLDRAEEIRSGHPCKFELRPLLPNVLQDFIAIEAQANNLQQLDSEYSRILLSLATLEGEDPNLLLRLQQLMKVIIDEGKSHWERFQLIKSTLEPFQNQPERYLRFTASPEPATGPYATLLTLCDKYYDLLLHALYITFRLGRRSRGFWLSVSHQAMLALDDAGFLLSEVNCAPRFELPDWCRSEEPYPELIQSYLKKPAKYGVEKLQFKELLDDKSAIDELFVEVISLLKTLLGAPDGLNEMALKHIRKMRVMKLHMKREYRSGKAARGEIQAVPFDR